MRKKYLFILFLSNILYSFCSTDYYVYDCNKKSQSSNNCTISQNTLRNYFETGSQKYVTAKLYIDSVGKNSGFDSIKSNNENEILERKWEFLGFFNATDKNGKVNEHSDPVYYDVSHLVYEGDSVLVMLKKGFTNKWYHYVSLNLKTKIIYRIDASTPYYGKSITIVWEDEWWKADDEFLNALYEAVKK